MPLNKPEDQDPEKGEPAGEKGKWEGCGCTLGGLSAGNTRGDPEAGTGPEVKTDVHLTSRGLHPAKNS